MGDAADTGSVTEEACATGTGTPGATLPWALGPGAGVAAGTGLARAAVIGGVTGEGAVADDAFAACAGSLGATLRWTIGPRAGVTRPAGLAGAAVGPCVVVGGAASGCAVVGYAADWCVRAVVGGGADVLGATLRWIAGPGPAVGLEPGSVRGPVPAGGNGEPMSGLASAGVAVTGAPSGERRWTGVGLAGAGDRVGVGLGAAAVGESPCGARVLGGLSCAG
jgi:hypothetical protein